MTPRPTRLVSEGRGILQVQETKKGLAREDQPFVV
jgi:hypothetical protein